MAPKELMSTHSSQDPAQKRNSLKDAQVHVKKVHQLIFVCWPERQGPAGILWGWKLVSPSLSRSTHFRTPVSPEGKLLHLSGVLGFVAATQGDTP